jgi:O-acetyl-ADP-ribose deacetylase (regulator of RNase III)
MTEYVEGNILEADVQALVNTVNTVGIMGKGIALQFKKAYPEMFKQYERACAHGEVEIGKMHVFDRGSLFNPRYVINFPTKKHWKAKSKIADIKAGLQDLIEQIKSRGISSIAVPPLGCGHGGLDWSEVQPLIVEAFEEVPDVQALIYQPAGAPEPEKQVIHTERPNMTPSRAIVLLVLNRYFVLGYQLSLLEVHKLLYFLQEAGEDLRLRFTKETYGPYADNLRHVLHKFEGHFTIGFGEGRNSPNTLIRLLPDALQEAERFVAADPQHGGPETEKRFERISELIEGFESPYGMELLASVHWVASHPEDKATDLDSTIRAVHGWNDRKRRTMKPEHVRIAWQRLRERGWIPQG